MTLLRVAFLIEETGERIGCMLNPQSLLLQRRTGVQSRHTVAGSVNGERFKDDQLLYTGGGKTELTLDLLFDVGVNGSSVQSDNVCDLTAPIWRLSENAQHQGCQSQPALCRFIWGKFWNIPAVVTAVAERLDLFDSDGIPKRSWLRMRLQRLTEQIMPSRASSPQSATQTSAAIGAEASLVEQEIVGGEVSGERLDQLAHHYYQDCSLWRYLAIFNNLADPMHIPDGMVLEIPPLVQGNHTP